MLKFFVHIIFLLTFATKLYLTTNSCKETY